MKKKSPKKLRVSRETLGRLALAQVRGGTETNSNCDTIFITCYTCDCCGDDSLGANLCECA